MAVNRQRQRVTCRRFLINTSGMFLRIDKSRRLLPSALTLNHPTPDNLDQSAKSLVWLPDSLSYQSSFSRSLGRDYRIVMSDPEANKVVALLPFCVNLAFQLASGIHQQLLDRFPSFEKLTTVPQSRQSGKP